jgi:hypothetical protein
MSFAVPMRLLSVVSKRQGQAALNPGIPRKIFIALGLGMR